ncbi:MAG: cysteine dioxygenase family protein [Bacteroidia bacterium]|nr:cysteine dioxygenase family protein [Bacteroidia bacterium]
MSNNILTNKSVETLVNSLDPEVKNFVEYGNVMNAIDMDENDLEPYCHWRKEFYTRNLIERTKAYELIVLCWDVDQYSPIHNHEGQDCWMYVAKGQMEEVQYKIESEENDNCVLKETNETNYTKGQVAYIHDGIGLHIIKNSGKEPAITIHLYANPINFCNVYDLEKGKITKRKLSYFSEKGELISNS